MRFSSSCTTTCSSNLPSYVPNEHDGDVCERYVEKGCQCDPYSASSNAEMYVSQVAHWNPIINARNSFNRAASSTLRSHYVRLPNPGEIFYTAKDIVDEMKELLSKQEKHAENCKQS